MIVVAALYQFFPVRDPEALQKNLKAFLLQANIKGTIIVAKEGINGTVSGTREDISTLKAFLAIQGFEDLEYKESVYKEHPFYRTKVKLKKEIVTMGLDFVSPLSKKGTYVEPREWNDLISDKNTILIDVRNDYEIEIGTFKNAINPQTKTFREFPDYVQTHLLNHKKDVIAMDCTGGVRCEKSTAYLLSLGFEKVYHLKGGILKYLEEVPPQESLFEGDCFIFDQRVGIAHGLDKSIHTKCHGCRMPLSPLECQSVHYEEGVKCHYCYNKYDDKHFSRARERHKQMMLAKDKGIIHMGDDHALHRVVRV